MLQQPSGTVTFLFTDIEGSTRRWEDDPDLMRDALAQHDTVVRATIEDHGGFVFATGGDGFAIAFQRASDAVSAAVDCQRALRTAGLPAVRMGLHTGEAVEREGDYFGPAVNRAARVMAVGHGGQVLVSGATEQVLTEVELRDLGEHRLRDLSRPVRIFQLLAPGLLDEFPRLHSLDSLPGNLPLQVTTFVGRDDAVKRITATVTDHRLITLTGVGGVGKTRLALQVAAEVLPEFTDGAWICELASVASGEAMVEVIAAAFGIATQPGLSPKQSIIEFLRGKHLLVVFDNCEHLLDDAADFVGRILSECSRVHVLATSREVLSVDGEQVRGVRSIEDEHAVRLFVDRARAVRADFEADAATEIVIGEICERLDGIPLAIELAAARVLAMQPREIAGLLDERFRLLSGGRRSGVERHQTLRATVEWSYSLLSETERIVFDRLAVFPGSFDSEAAVAVASEGDLEAWDVFDALGGLVGKSMLVADALPEGVSRYAMLETLRQYGRERLGERVEIDAFRRRHSAYFAQLAEQTGPDLTTKREIVARRRALTELDNYRAAVVWSLDREPADDALLGIRIIAALALLVTSARSAGLGVWAERAVPRLDGVDLGLRVAVLGAAAFGALNRGDPEAALQLAREGVSEGLPRSCPAPVLAAGALGVATSVSDIAAGIALVRDGAQSLEAIDDQYGAIVLRIIAVIYSALIGETDSARREIDVLLPQARAHGNPTNLVIALYAYASTWWQDNPQAAHVAIEESFALTDQGASDIVAADAHELLARIRHAVGDTRGGLAAVVEGQRLADDVGNRQTSVSILWFAVELLASRGANDIGAICIGISGHGPYASVMNAMVGPEAEAHDAAEQAIRTAIGDSGYEQLVAEGAAMSYEELVGYTQRAISEFVGNDSNW